MEIGLKERLIGAGVLVVLGVIIIPFFLKGSPAPDSSVSQPLTLPPSDSTAPQQQYSLPLAGGTAAGPATALMPAATAPAPAAATVPVAPVHAISRPAQPAAKPAAKPAAAPATQSGGKWTVQAGSYGSQANADKVVKTLKAHGIKASVSHFSKAGHTYYRVRVGPYAERPDADKAAAAVSKALGAKASVVPND